MGLLITAVISIPLAFLISSITDTTGKTIGRLFYAGKEPRWTIKEKFQSEVDQVMFLKGRSNFRRL